MPRFRSRFAPPRAPLTDYPPEVRDDIAKLRDLQDRAEAATVKFEQGQRALLAPRAKRRKK